jgi:hypothetical protein
VAAEVDSRVAVDPWKGALKKGTPIWVCNGWKVLMKKKLKVEFFQCNWRAGNISLKGSPPITVKFWLTS